MRNSETMVAVFSEADGFLAMARRAREGISRKVFSRAKPSRLVAHPSTQALIVANTRFGSGK